MVKLVENSKRPSPATTQTCFTGRSPSHNEPLHSSIALVLIRARYYDCVTGEFTSQDPLEYVDGMSLQRGYFLLGGVDPKGTFSITVYGSDDVPDGPAGSIVPGRKICAVPLLEAGRPLDRWLGEARRAGDFVLERGAASAQEILDFVKEKGCCTLYTIGHQGSDNDVSPVYGGTVTYPDKSKPKTPSFIFPNEEFEKSLSKVFREHNKCSHCAINIVACGGANKEKEEENRRDIANRTGCLVCGTPTTISAGGSFADVKHPNNTTVGEICGGVTAFGEKPWHRKRWPYKCYSPSVGGWKKEKRVCVDWYVYNRDERPGKANTFRTCTKWETIWVPGK